jgi:hypothetical protein
VTIQRRTGSATISAMAVGSVTRRASSISARGRGATGSPSRSTARGMREVRSMWKVRQLRT